MTDKPDKEMQDLACAILSGIKDHAPGLTQMRMGAEAFIEGRDDCEFRPDVINVAETKQAIRAIAACRKQAAKMRDDLAVIMGMLGTTQSECQAAVDARERDSAKD